MRVVLTVDVWLMALLAASSCAARLLNRWLAGEAYTPIMCREMLDEAERLLAEPRMAQRHGLDAAGIRGLRQRWESQVVVIEAAGQAEPLALRCALAGQAGFIVTHDPALLALGQYRGVQILTPMGWMAFRHWRETACEPDTLAQKEHRDR